MTPPEALEKLVEIVLAGLEEYPIRYPEDKYKIGKPVVNTVPITIGGTDFLLQLKKVSK